MISCTCTTFKLNIISCNLISKDIKTTTPPYSCFPYKKYIWCDLMNWNNKAIDILRSMGTWTTFSVMPISAYVKSFRSSLMYIIIWHRLTTKHCASHWWLCIQEPTSNISTESLSTFKCVPAKKIIICNADAVPADTLRNNDVIITSKRRHFDVITSKLRRFHVITMLLLRHKFGGILQVILVTIKLLHWQPFLICVIRT